MAPLKYHLPQVHRIAMLQLSLSKDTARFQKGLQHYAWSFRNCTEPP